ncbi:MAG TPA: hypothetical protein DD706_15150 [Nitrospiraceae bacterium]|nr:hypothetical protein [Nitrospiraceae bacterium]
MPLTEGGIAAKAENRGLLFHSHSLKNQAVEMPEFLPFDELPKGLAYDKSPIQMPTRILAGEFQPCLIDKPNVIIPVDTILNRHGLELRVG